jgi:hypothetical protein
MQLSDWSDRVGTSYALPSVSSGFCSILLLAGCLRLLIDLDQIGPLKKV